jgi:hypothetical protein
MQEVLGACSRVRGARHIFNQTAHTKECPVGVNQTAHTKECPVGVNQTAHTKECPVGLFLVLMSSPLPRWQPVHSAP